MISSLYAGCCLFQLNHFHFLGLLLLLTWTSVIFVDSFHTYDYARHFVSACTRILGLEGTPEGVEYQGKLTRVAAVCTHRVCL